MAVSSYLPDVAGGIVAAAAFDDDAAAERALAILAESDVRPPEISVIARDMTRAAGEEEALYDRFTIVEPPTRLQREPGRHRMEHREVEVVLERPHQCLEEFLRAARVSRRAVDDLQHVGAIGAALA